MRRKHLSAATGVLLGSVGVSLLAFAQMEPGETRTFPYHGRLELNGAAASDPHDFRFGLFATASADASCLVTGTVGCGIWAEQHDDVELSQGRFGVLLGQAGGLGDAQLASPRLFLGIAVSGPGDQGAFHLLDSKQEIHPVPWASRAAVAKDYRVTGSLEVLGDAYVDTLEVADDTSLGTVTLRKQGMTSRIGFAAQTNDPGEIVHFENNNVGELWLSSSDDWGTGVENDRIVFGQFPGGPVRHEFKANGDARISRHLSVDGNLSVGGVIQSSCNTGRTTGCSDDGSGETYYLDRHNISCNANEHLRQWRMLRCNNNNGLYFQYTCCSF